MEINIPLMRNHDSGSENMYFAFFHGSLDRELLWDVFKLQWHHPC